MMLQQTPVHRLSSAEVGAKFRVEQFQLNISYDFFLLALKVNGYRARE